MPFVPTVEVRERERESCVGVVLIDDDDSSRDEVESHLDLY